MVASFQSLRNGSPDLVSKLHAGPRVGESEALSFQYLTVSHGVKIGESLAEFDLFSVHHEAAEGPLARFLQGCRKVFEVDAQEPPDAGILKLQITGRLVFRKHMHGALFYTAEDPDQHVEEMDADVGGNASRFGFVSFPRMVVPVPAGSDISEVDVVRFQNRLFADPGF